MTGYEVVQISGARCLLNLFERSRWPSVADIVFDRFVEQDLNSSLRPEPSSFSEFVKGFARERVTLTWPQRV